MVLINEKKYACATCIKGHRVSSCTHTDRPLFEVKKKGRPATQCQFCREKRKGGGGSGSVHSKCACGDLKNQAPVSILLNADGSVRPNPADTPVAAAPSATETRKGQPGSTPTFPNGLRDVHEMAAAAQALSGLGDTSNQAAERKLQNLLNPCNCATTGKCKCCGPKRAREYPPPRSRSPVRDGTTHAQVTDSLIEMFKSKATTTTITSPSEGNSGSSTPQQAAHLRTLNLAMTSTSSLASPDNRHRPSHTSPHVHKTRLYSPYSTNGSSTPRHGGKTRSESVSSTGSHGPGWMSPGTSPRPPLPRIRPLTDMNRFLGAAFKEDGSMATEISRSALGLPGIHAFDNLVGGTADATKMEMDVDVDAPLAFPTAEPVVIGACTCGDGCECPGCATHGNTNASPSAQQHPHECGDACKSCFDCSEHVSIPSGVTSIEQLIQVAASQVPQHPPRPHTASQLNPLDTNVLPPAANVSQDAARAFGLVQLLPLQCCNGRCQCAPGQCSCEAECCGCCVRCLCDHDGDTVMAEQEKPSGCCSTAVVPPAPVVQTEDEDSPGGCCGGDSSPVAPTPPMIQTQMLSVASAQNGSPQHLSPNSISPTSPTAGRMASPGAGATAASSSCCKTTASNSPAPGASGTPCGTGSGSSSTPNPQPPGGVIRRNSSVSRAKEAANAGAGTARRVSISNGSIPNRPATASSSKTASKALALHPNQARAILPKSSGARLAPRAASSSNRQPSPVHRGSVSGSSQPSQNGSPVAGAVPLPSTGDTLTVPDGSASGVSAPNSSNPSHTRQRSRDMAVHGGESGTDAGGMAVGVNDIANALAASDVDFMAYLNSLLTTGDGAGSAPVPEQNATAGPSSSAPDALAGSGYSFTTSLAVSSATNDLSLLGIQPGAAAPQTPRIPDVESSMGDIQQLIASTLEQQGVMPRLDPSSGDYAYWLNMAQAGGGQQQAYPFGDGSLAVPPNPLLSTSPAPPAPQAQAAFLKPDQNLYFGNYGAGYPSMPSQLPHSPMRSVSSSSVGDSMPPHISQPMPPAPAIQAPQAIPALPQSLGRTNPDLIDLSKPLNPSDVDRILQALLTQQSRTGGGGGVPSVPQPSPPLERSDVFKDYMLDPSIVDMRGQHAASQGQPSSSAQQQHQQQQHEWLRQSGWAPTLMNQTPPS